MPNRKFSLHTHKLVCRRDFIGDKPDIQPTRLTRQAVDDIIIGKAVVYTDDDLARMEAIEKERIEKLDKAKEILDKANEERAVVTQMLAEYKEKLNDISDLQMKARETEQHAEQQAELALKMRDKAVQLEELTKKRLAEVSKPSLPRVAQLGAKKKVTLRTSK